MRRSRKVKGAAGSKCVAGPAFQPNDGETKHGISGAAVIGTNRTAICGYRERAFCITVRDCRQYFSPGLNFSHSVDNAAGVSDSL